jgi:hypothetical protein
VRIDGAALVAVITVLGTMSVGAITGLFSWVVRRQSRTIDIATARKTEAEAVAEEVKTARELLTDMKTYFNERLSAQAAEHKEDLAEVSHRVEELKTQVRELVEERRTLLASYYQHRQWDQTAWVRLLQIDPVYPPPPSIEGLS